MAGGLVRIRSFVQIDAEFEGGVVAVRLDFQAGNVGDEFFSS